MTEDSYKQPSAADLKKIELIGKAIELQAKTITALSEEVEELRAENLRLRARLEEAP